MKTRSQKLKSNHIWKLRNPERIKEYTKKRAALIASSPELRERKLAQNRESARRNYAKRKAYDKARDPLKTRARRLVRNRVFRGTLTKLPCEICGDPKSQAHHENYSQPLDIKWLCAKHHKEAHTPKTTEL